MRVTRLVDLRHRQRERDDADRDVDQEDPAPAQAVGERPADDRSDRHRRTGHGAPDTERDPAVASTIGVTQQRKRGREHHRAADPLHPAREVEHQRRLRDPAQQRSRRENHQPDREYPPSPEQVCERTGSQQQRCERERVGVNNPLQVCEARPQPGLDLRQRDIHDRDVEQQHERSDTDSDESPPLTHGVADGDRSRTTLHTAVPLATAVSCRHVCLRPCLKCDDSLRGLGRCSHQRSPRPTRPSHPGATTALNPPASTQVEVLAEGASRGIGVVFSRPR